MLLERPISISRGRATSWFMDDSFHVLQGSKLKPHFGLCFAVTAQAPVQYCGCAWVRTGEPGAVKSLGSALPVVPASVPSGPAHTRLNSLLAVMVLPLYGLVYCC